MCKAIEEMMSDAEAKGKLDLLAELIKDNLISIDEAAKHINMSVKEFEEQMNLLA